jgi:hypothetical protein
MIEWVHESRCPAFERSAQGWSFKLVPWEALIAAAGYLVQFINGLPDGVLYADGQSRPDMCIVSGVFVKLIREPADVSSLHSHNLCIPSTLMAYIVRISSPLLIIYQHT